MKFLFQLCCLLFLVTIFTTSCSNETAVAAEKNNQTVVPVDPKLFLTSGGSVAITTVACTLASGEETTCYQIITGGKPADHQMGPWCPDNIDDGAVAGGIWVEGGKKYDVSGAFIKNMATFYNDDTWLMYDESGKIFTTDTKEDCANAANPNVGPEYANFCVECLPDYIADLTNTYLLPVTPVRLVSSISFGRGGPGGKGGAPSNRGIAFNGVVFDAPAPTHAILGAHTLAPFDDAGGHINLHAGYHYHSATGLSTKITQQDDHAPMIGYAMDGYGLFAQLNKDGKESTDLDECRGHYDETRGYHYHADAPGSNNFINCMGGAYVKK